VVRLRLEVHLGLHALWNQQRDPNMRTLQATWLWWLTTGHDADLVPPMSHPISARPVLMLSPSSSWSYLWASY
jgi:hypothetical protein